MLIRHVIILEVLLSLSSLAPIAANQAGGAAPPPPGTAIPVMFSHTLDSARVKPGDPIVAKTTQIIVLPSGERIPRGAKLAGQIVAANLNTSNGPSQLAIRFDTLEYRDRSVSIRVGLRAMASFVDSYGTSSPIVDHGYPDNSVYGQVGGDYFLPGDTVYSRSGDEVGKANHDGVFVKLARVEHSNSQSHVVCEQTDTLQSVGVFSSNACGLYGFQDLFVDEVGATMDGTIQFHSDRHSARINRGTAALMQVISTGR
jgi:hypothetical protein